jgi:hypothetical protein
MTAAEVADLARSIQKRDKEDESWNGATNKSALTGWKEGQAAADDERAERLKGQRWYRKLKESPPSDSAGSEAQPMTPDQMLAEQPVAETPAKPDLIDPTKELKTVSAGNDVKQPAEAKPHTDASGEAPVDPRPQSHAATNRPARHRAPKTEEPNPNKGAVDEVTGPVVQALRRSDARKVPKGAHRKKAPETAASKEKDWPKIRKLLGEAAVTAVGDGKWGKRTVKAGRAATEVAKGVATKEGLRSTRQRTAQFLGELVTSAAAQTGVGLLLDARANRQATAQAREIRIERLEEEVSALKKLLAQHQ